MSKRFYLKSYVKKNPFDAYAIIHDGPLTFRMYRLTLDNLEKFKKKYFFVIGPCQQDNPLPNPRYATSKELAEQLKEYYKE